MATQVPGSSCEQYGFHKLPLQPGDDSAWVSSAQAISSLVSSVFSRCFLIFKPYGIATDMILTNEVELDIGGLLLCDKVCLLLGQLTNQPIRHCPLGISDSTRVNPSAILVGAATRALWGLPDDSDSVSPTFDLTRQACKPAS
ncbi:hypothetical protein [Oceanobacter antarcticus]|uniref:ROK family protein n=1 Tax=Oceanobacter antarcticus TaxID=3133425 RepID=A0ABW8NNI4_9GAMM